jgi:hypothetical protein
LSSVRPRHLAVWFALFFGLVAYFAYAVARNTTGPWYGPSVSQMVYQTTMVGALIVLAGLLAAASYLPPFSRFARAAGLPVASGRDLGGSASSREPSAAFSPGRAAADDPWDDEDFFDDPDSNGTEDASPRRVRNAAAVSAALTRMEGGASRSVSEALMDQLSGIRAREARVAPEQDPAQTLRRLANEIRPLLIAAKGAGVNVAQVQRLFLAATVGREGDLAYRVRVVEEMKRTLESALSEHASRELHSLLRDLERSKPTTDRDLGAETTAAEAVALLDTGHYAAAIDRARDARRILDEQRQPRLHSVPSHPTPASFAAFVGPTFASAVFVAIAAMLLPGTTGFLEANYTLNTGVILFLSYGWFGLVLYAIISIFVATRPPTLRRQEWDSFEDDFEVGPPVA